MRARPVTATGARIARPETPRVRDTRRVVVVATACGGDTPAGWADVAARRCAAALDELGEPRPRAVRLDPDTDLRPLWSSSSAGSEVVAVGLVGATAPRAAHVRAAVAAAGGPVVVTDHDASTIALVAATLTGLGDRRRRVEAAQVVVAGARRLPGLAEQLVAASVGEVALWNPQDAPGYPLSSVAEGADVLINLLGPGAGGPALPTVCSAHSGPVVVAPDPLRDVPLVLPGLVHALGGFAGLPVDEAELDTHDMHGTCALELVMNTPPGHRLPAPSKHLSARIADAVARSLPGRSRRPFRTDASTPPPTTTPEIRQGESP